MDLLQEYYERHGITLPMVRHVDRNHLVFVAAEKEAEQTAGRYTLLTVSFSTKPDNHPGTFRFLQSAVAYDAGNSSTSSSPTRNLWDKKLEWDDYEPFILEWAAANKGKVVLLTTDQTTLALWEMFAYSHDSWLAQNLSPRQIDLLCTVLDTAHDTEGRRAAAVELEGVLKSRNKGVFAAFNTLRNSCTDRERVADWLANMLK